MSNKTTIKDVVNSIDKEWRGSWSGSYDAAGVGSLCPVLLALKKSLETDDPDGWTSSFEKANGIDPATEMLSVDLGFQLYSERLLAQMVAEQRG